MTEHELPEPRLPVTANPPPSVVSEVPAPPRPPEVPAPAPRGPVGFALAPTATALRRRLGLILGGVYGAAACGGTLDLGARRSLDGGEDRDSGAEASAGTGDGSLRDAGENEVGASLATCGRGTVRRSCQVFLTDTAVPPNFGGLAGGDARCAASALGGGLSGTFKAYLSDGTIAAWSRFRSDGPWLIVGSNATIFPDAAALRVDGRLPLLNRNELGNGFAPLGQWTGVREGGLGGNACGGFTSTSPNLRGSYGISAFRWLFEGERDCNYGELSLICLED